MTRPCHPPGLVGGPDSVFSPLHAVFPDWMVDSASRTDRYSSSSLPNRRSPAAGMSPARAISSILRQSSHRVIAPTCAGLVRIGPLARPVGRRKRCLDPPAPIPLSIPGDPLCKRFVELMDRERLAQVIVHPGWQATGAVAPAARGR